MRRFSECAAIFADPLILGFHEQERAHDEYIHLDSQKHSSASLGSFTMGSCSLKDLWAAASEVFELFYELTFVAVLLPAGDDQPLVRAHTSWPRPAPDHPPI